MTRFAPDFVAEVTTPVIAPAPDLRLELVTAWDPGTSTLETLMVTDVEKVLSVSARREAFERRPGFIRAGSITIVVTNTLGTLTTDVAQIGSWARIYIGLASIGRWQPFLQGRISDFRKLGDQTAQVVIDDVVELLLSAKLKQAAAWFATTQTFDLKDDRENPSSGNFITGHKPVLVDGEWDYREGPYAHEGEADAGAYPVSASTDILDRAVCTIEFLDDTNFQYSWSNDPGYVYDNGGSGYSRNANQTLSARVGGADVAHCVVYAAGWADAVWGAGDAKIAAGDTYRIDFVKAKTGAGTFGNGRFNPIEVVREIVQDLFAVTRPPLTYGYDGNAEAGYEVSVIDTDSEGAWQAASDGMETDSVRIWGAWDEGTTALEMIQDALRVAVASVWATPAGDLGIAIVQPTDEVPIAFDGTRGAAGENLLDTPIEATVDRDRIAKMKVRYRAELSGAEVEADGEDDAASEVDKDRYFREMPVGWRTQKTNAERMITLALLRQSRAPTRYELRTTLLGALTAEVFQGATVRDPAAGIDTTAGKIYTAELDPLGCEMRFEVLHEPLLEGELYARVDIDNVDGPKVVW